MVVIDAVASSLRVPLWRFIGGASNTITTDITIPIVSSAEAAELASKYYKQGFKTLKLKVGKNLNADIEVLQAIRVAHPELEVLEKLHEMGLTPILFEQLVHRDDWDGLGYMSNIAREKYEVFVAADESNTIKDRNELMEIHIPFYLSSISKGVATVMVSYSSWNGMNMHIHNDLITGYLKNTLHFQGFVISDYEGSKSADSAAVTIATNMVGRGTDIILGRNAEFME
ncbi:L-Ala-D/L-amino acid epimerase-like [Vicia villosa]|uniref:L-Ala-D/L-amino acid epimerase-like n=1 Tax=Vicia villosa TaxID=3911 RepID=UPI00273B762A|nr:L-Ala-D/L-amino acid epimerase-like [Vicia villosa]